MLTFYQCSTFFYPAGLAIDSKSTPDNAATIAAYVENTKLKEFLREEFELKPSRYIAAQHSKLNQLSTAIRELGTEQVPRLPLAGFMSDHGGLIYRPPRSPARFAGDRERQLLKHISTILYFNLPRKISGKSKKGKTITKSTLAEIELMHFRYSGCDMLFIAGNEAKITAFFYSQFRSIQSLKKALTGEQLTTKTKDKEGKKRIKRYTLYLNKIVSKNKLPFKKTKYENKQDLIRYRQIMRILRKTKKIEHCKIMYKRVPGKLYGFEKQTKAKLRKLINTPREHIIFLDTSKMCVAMRSRHAEEILTDVAEFIRNIARKEKKGTYAAIAGKKRPCLTCYARMSTSSAIQKHGYRPGLFWIGRLKEQRIQNPKAARFALRSLTDSSFVTVDPSSPPYPKELSGYDSGTDDEQLRTRPRRSKC